MENFYIRYYVGHKGKFGHEFLEFEFRPDGQHVMCNFIAYARIRICFSVQRVPFVLLQYKSQDNLLFDRRDYDKLND